MTKSVTRRLVTPRPFLKWVGGKGQLLDKLIEQALATVDDGKRRKLLEQGTELAMRDYGVIPLHYQVNTWAVRKGLKYTPRTDERTEYAFVVSK